MESTTLNFLKGTRNHEIRPVYVCEDGFSLSIQASAFHHCSPCVTGASYYTFVEIGYPSQYVREFQPYAADNEGDVFDMVPVTLVDRIINSHNALRCEYCGRKYAKEIVICMSCGHPT